MADELKGDAAVGAGDSVGDAGGQTMQDVEDSNAKDDADFLAGFGDEDSLADEGSPDSDDDKGKGSPDSDADDPDDDDNGEAPPRDDKGRFVKQESDDAADQKGEAKPDKAKPDNSEKDTKAEPPPPKRSMTELISDALTDIADGDIEVQGTKVNIKEYIADYPEEAGAAAAIAARIVEKAMEGFTPGNDDGKLGERLQMLEDEVLAFRFWDSVSSEYPEARRTVATKTFKDWIEKQPSGVKKLAVSVDPGDALTVLGMYSKETAKPATQSKVKQKATALYSDSGRSGGKLSGGSEDDFDAGFNM
jgi:hypothetical protein